MLIHDISIAIEMKVNSEWYLKRDSDSVLYFMNCTLVCFVWLKQTSKSFGWNFCQNLKFLCGKTNLHYKFLPRYKLLLYINYTKIIPTLSSNQWYIITNCNQLFDQLINYLDLKIFRQQNTPDQFESDEVMQRHGNYATSTTLTSALFALFYLLLT